LQQGRGSRITSHQSRDLRSYPVQGLGWAVTFC
jgi:hypothetical protein